MNVGQSRAGNSAYFLLWIACARSLTRGVLAVLPGSRKNFPVGSSIFSWAEADAISAAGSPGATQYEHRLHRTKAPFVNASSKRPFSFRSPKIARIKHLITNQLDLMQHVSSFELYE
jgi:hypothetical protein